MVAKLTVSVGSGKLVYEKRKLRAVMRAAGSEVAAVTRAMIRGSGSGRKYYGTGGAKYRGGYQKGVFQASAPGDPPAKVTGTLAASIRVRPFKTGEGVAIRAGAFYALFLENGASGGGKLGTYKRRHRRGANAGKQRTLEPRRFLSRALEQRGASIGERIKSSIAEDVKFVRMKVGRRS